MPFDQDDDDHVRGKAQDTPPLQGESPWLEPGGYLSDEVAQESS
jgi:hypothetical protein